MSLTSELKNSKSPVATFFKQYFPNTGRLVRQTSPSLNDAETSGSTTSVLSPGCSMTVSAAGSANPAP